MLHIYDSIKSDKELFSSKNDEDKMRERFWLKNSQCAALSVWTLHISPSLYMFFVGAQASSHSPKTCKGIGCSVIFHV